MDLSNSAGQLKRELDIAIEYIQSTKEDCINVKDIGDANIACMNAIVNAPVIVNGRIKI